MMSGTALQQNLGLGLHHGNGFPRNAPFSVPWTGTALHHVMKAGKNNRNHPSYTQAMSEPLREEFLKAMINEIKLLRKHGMW